ncbi:cell division protein FtsL [Vibrio kanaloae]|uniref:cell division protein FtsL n=1 Tax=Vibrio kanaloae TaxID=170673 RepID=UPI0010BE4A5E|nr:cell division protein FtsL [Vibrio kanaloae]TKE98373.1 cell division protein FtsL [Vibrio kanaloae]TKF19859.1 cell division protein FtsL [Vibrio kanaloae]
MKTSKSNLSKIIFFDLISVGKVPLVLLICIFASAMGVVLTTHMSRQAITQKDTALVEREQLDDEWRNLMLEETALAEHSRVQASAKRELDMKRPDSDKEVVITLK